MNKVQLAVHKAKRRLANQLYSQVKTDEGLVISANEEEIVVGTEVFIEDTETGDIIPCPDGTYVADGKTYVVASGKVTEIKEETEEPVNTDPEPIKEEEEESPEEGDPKPDERDARIEELEALVASLQAENEQLRAQIEELGGKPEAEPIEERKDEKPKSSLSSEILAKVHKKK